MVDDIQTVDELEEACLCGEGKEFVSSLLHSIFADEVYAISTPDRTWKKSSNYRYSSALGVLIKEKHTMKWTVKNAKITNNGQRARIQTKIHYNYIPLGTTITHKVGAWMYNDGGCDFD